MNKSYFFGVEPENAVDWIACSFDEDESNLPAIDNILFLCHDDSECDADVYILFEKDGGLYEVVAGHCSCFGFEGQWEPFQVTWKALAMRPNWFTKERAKAWTHLVQSHTEALDKEHDAV